MYTADTMSLGTALVYSLLGLTVVFLALISLSVAIIISSKIIRSIEGAASHSKAPTKAAPVVSDEEDKELLAVLASVISEDLGSGPDEIRITSVTELR